MLAHTQRWLMFAAPCALVLLSLRWSAVMGRSAGPWQATAKVQAL